MERSYGTVVTADPKDLDEIMQALHELHKQSDRAAAIVGAAILDVALTHALKRYLHQSELAKGFFSVRGPVGNLGPKIDLALLIGLLGQDTHRDFVIVRDIPNKFAHSLAVSDFKSDPIAALSKKLKIADQRTFDSKAAPRKGCWMGVVNREAMLTEPRDRFLLSVNCLIYGLSIPGKTAMPSPVF